MASLWSQAWRFITAGAAVYVASNYGLLMAVAVAVLVHSLGSVFHRFFSKLEVAPELSSLGLELIQGNVPEAGKPALVEIWATWCPPCVRNIPHLDALYRQYGSRVSFIAISPESTATVRRFVESKRETMTYPVACSSSAPSAFNVMGFPSAFIIADDGKTILWEGHPASPTMEVLAIYERNLSKRGIRLSR